MSFLGDAHLIPIKWVRDYPSTAILVLSKELVMEFGIKQKTIFRIEKHETKDGALLSLIPMFILDASEEKQASNPKKQEKQK
jgi:hypothetical protein